MAEVWRVHGNYAIVPDGNIESVFAHHVTTRAGLARAAETVEMRARSNLSRHRHDGHARIDHEQGGLDHYIVLSDERGQGAAMSIEFGRGQWIDEDGVVHPGSEPTYILSDAARIGGKANFPRRSRGSSRGRAGGGRRRT